VVEVVDHEFDALGIIFIRVPLEVFGLSGIGVSLVTRNLNNARLSFLEVASVVRVFATCEFEELRLGANDGFVDFVGVRTADDHEVAVITTIFETIRCVSGVPIPVLVVKEVSLGQAFEKHL